MAAPSDEELMEAGKSFLYTMFGAGQCRRWQAIRKTLHIPTESEFVQWLLDTAEKNIGSHEDSKMEDGPVSSNFDCDVAVSPTSSNCSIQFLDDSELAESVSQTEKSERFEAIPVQLPETSQNSIPEKLIAPMKTQSEILPDVAQQTSQREVETSDFSSLPQNTFHVKEEILSFDDLEEGFGNQPVPKSEKTAHSMETLQPQPPEDQKLGSLPDPSFSAINSLQQLSSNLDATFTGTQVSPNFFHENHSKPVNRQHAFNYKRHFKDCRTRNKKIPVCLICNELQETRFALKTHYLTKHAEKIFSCKFCDYVTPRHGHFNVHQRLHTGERPYKCPLCHYTAYQKSPIMTHLAKGHTISKDELQRMSHLVCRESNM